MAAQLTTDAGRNALTAVLLVATSKLGVVGELEACMDGARGAELKASGAEMDVALSDYVSNGMSNGQWNAQHFRACIRRAKQAERPPPGASSSNDSRSASPRRGGVAARTFANAQDALRNLTAVPQPADD